MYSDQAAGLSIINFYLSYVLRNPTFWKLLEMFCYCVQHYKRLAQENIVKDN